MNDLKTKFLKKEFSYTGPELRPLFLYENGIQGSGVLSWIGPCDVTTDNLVDFEDRMRNETIFSNKMVHFVGEFFHRDIFYGIMVQRLLAEIIKTYVKNQNNNFELVRKGDDLYFEDKKFNVSIATVGNLSTLIHFGVNVDSDDTPVKTVSLNDMEIKASSFASDILSELKSELDSIEKASCKVFSV